MPPGSAAGRSFIHDPTISDKTEIKGNIKLRFTNKSKAVQVVGRSYELSKKKGNKLEFKTLDGYIRTCNENGEKVSLSQKCTELDKHIPELMGVSRAVLDSVIFCHQEDSCWALEEGAILKKKFDAIFESTRY